MGCTSSKAATADEPGTQPQSAAASAQAAPGKSSASSGRTAAPAATTPATTDAPPRKSFTLTSSGPPPEGKQLREATEKPKIIFVIGGPGSGKGTQCAKIVEQYSGGVRHISSGDLLRAEVSKGTELGNELESIMKAGKLVSDDKIIQLLEQEISASAWFGLAYLVDGFPRAVPQAKKFEEQVRPADLVLYFECPESVMKERITERGKSSGRKDDNPETVKGRLQTFKKESLPVVEHYAKQDKLKKVSAVPPPDEVFMEVSKALEEFLEGSNGSSKPEQGEVQQWRSNQVLDMEKRFYGGLQDEPAAEESEIPHEAQTVPTSVTVV